jgi:uncharacterized protein (DUF2062 family)
VWRRRWKVLVLDLLGREEPPERVAAAIGVGVAIGFSPFVGFHLVMALAIAFLFRLNKLDAILGTLVGNVPTWGVVFPLGYRLGRAIMGLDRRVVPRMNLQVLLHSDITWVFHPVQTLHMVFGHRAFEPRLLSFLIGTTTLAIVLGLVTAMIARSVLLLYHRRHPRVAIRAQKRRSGAHWKAPAHSHKADAAAQASVERRPRTEDRGPDRR